VPQTQAERRALAERGLVLAAIDVVAEAGVAAATFEAIGQRAGYSRGLATQRFGSKQGLIDAVIDELHQTQEAGLAEFGIDAMSGFEAVLAYVALHLSEEAIRGQSRAYFRLLASAVADAATLRSAFAVEHGRVQTRLADFMRRGQAEGDIRPELDADAAALMIGSLLLGLSMQLLVDPSMDMEPIRQTTLATLRISFGAGDPGQQETTP
jgi:AcrR family transcriptional regulator